MSRMRVIGACVVLVGCLAGVALAGDVQVVIKWPSNAPTPEVQNQSDASGKAFVVTDLAHHRVTLINVPRDWSPTVTPANVTQPSVRVAHSGARSDQVIVRAYLGDEFLTDVTLVAIGEVAEFPTATRVGIELKR